MKVFFGIHLTTLESYFLPAYNNNHKIAYFKNRAKRLSGWDFHNRYITNINSRGNMDNISGGWFPTQREVVQSVLGESSTENLVGELNWTISVNNWRINNLEHIGSFIPTISALGFKNPNFNWSQKLDRNLVCSNETPFDSYFGPDVNEQHTSFTEASVNWLLKELAGNEQEPFFPINANSLVGKTSVCDRQSTTYTFNSCKIPGNVANWQVSSNLQIVNSNGTSVTVKPPSDSRSLGWVKATFNNGKSVTKNIWVGRPKSASSISRPTTVNTGALVSYYGQSVGSSCFKHKVHNNTSNKAFSDLLNFKTNKLC